MFAMVTEGRCLGFRFPGSLYPSLQVACWAQEMNNKLVMGMPSTRYHTRTKQRLQYTAAQSESSPAVKIMPLSGKTGEEISFGPPRGEKRIYFWVCGGGGGGVRGGGGGGVKPGGKMRGKRGLNFFF
jgi:hypothetical protein